MTTPSSSLAAEPKPVRVLRRLGWGVADQAVSSLGNLVLGVVVARSLGAEGFGAFSLALITYAFIVTASRGVSSDPLVVRFSGQESSSWSAAVGAATGMALVAGVVTGAACVVVGLALPGAVGAGFVALGVGLPGALLQDSYRFAFFSRGDGVKAFLNDLLWTVMQTVGVVALLLTGHATAVTCLLVFGGTATVAAVVAFWQCGVGAEVGAARRWLVDQQDLGGRFLVENVAVGGSRQLRMFAVGALAGLADVGEIRATEILMGPFLVLASGLSQVAVPEAREVLLRDPSRLTRFCGWLGALPAAAALAWGGALLVTLPMGVGALLLDGLWEPAHQLVVPITGILAVGCFHNACAAGVRALGAARRSLFAQLSNAALYVVSGGAGAVLGGASGSSWGVFWASLAGTVIWWQQLRRGLADERAATHGQSTHGQLSVGAEPALQSWSLSRPARRRGGT